MRLDRDTLGAGPGTAAGQETAGHPRRERGLQQLQRLRDNLIGDRATISTPYGERPLVYADYTASGRAVAFIEDNIRQRVLPYYANTHTEASFTGAQTNALREQARAQIRRAVNGGESDKVIFCGSGATAAINRLIDILGLRRPQGFAGRRAGEAMLPEEERPVVFVGPYEHHSNELPWRETVADVVRIGLDPRGAIDATMLEQRLRDYAGRPLMIGSFSAASNVTGLRSDVPGITRLLKAAGALAFWDFAAAGPYQRIDMNARGAPMDALFLSPHKFPGGPGTPGVLVAREALFANPVPAVVGGGTVRYVSSEAHYYLDDPEQREEGGTPAIVESIRAGAVFALKEQIGCDTIEAIEDELVERAFAAFSEVPQIEVLGPRDLRRLSIFSLRLHTGDRELHHGFVAALLNDLFGIQARGGCSCAGPYGHDLLGIDGSLSRSIDTAVTAGHGSFKPGWVRINLHYIAPEEEIDYVLEALRLVAEQGWRLLPSYRLDPRSGLWTHRDSRCLLPLSLEDLTGDAAPAPTLATALPELLDSAREILAAGATEAHRQASLAEPALAPELESIRWFLTAAEAAQALDAVECGILDYGLAVAQQRHVARKGTG